MDETPTSVNSFTTTDKELENNLKDLLERILIYAEKHIETKEELNQIESELKDYESLSYLVGIIKVIFTKLMLKIEKKLLKLDKCNDQNKSQFYKDDEEYDKLEQNLIKYEQEIRNHISVEQQLKLFAESIQNKLDESESIRQELLETTKNNISKLKRENYELNEKEKQLQQEVNNLKSTIQNLEKENKRKSIDSNQRDYLQTLINKQANQQQNLTKNGLSQESRHLNSHSEHQSNPRQFLKEQQDLIIPTQSSQKLNYYNFINNANTKQKSEVIRSMQQKDFNNIYNQIMRSKHNSLSSINELINNVTQQDKKRTDQLQSISKNSSQNNSMIQKNRDYKQIEPLELQQRSKSSKRADDIIKYQTLESLIKLK
ncbi:unnamed protein product (macronuclear) [Paramecium tetraurelia]|uniref:Uncharacterized protein n=1 Tax=Paramecium tetraurelia TaxID=5888 RepID=A0BXW1_PARTE|nr:uncharacterized protein GSPATT00033231001 [Paramecium tetraurelia]CAK63378.1 unnamed protein product [Paramecium tetraurelia]|eukprot:XP_001430776.1 hypothetical protein (macronuclear) [Paramecium tetraurelia strain d4-2]